MQKSDNKNHTAAMSAQFQPLYMQVYDLLVARLSDGTWKPAQALPSEFELADQLGVSQGTVRKALNLMVSQSLLLRRQGKGTFVAEHTAESSLFRFFRYREPGGGRVTPQTKVISMHRRDARQHEIDALTLGSDVRVVEMIRLRYINDKPAIYEMVVQPLSVFPDIDKFEELINSLYELYQTKFAISIVEVRDELQAVELTQEQAEYLNLSAGSPALLTERSSINIDGRVVEWSQAYCSTEHFVYSVSVR